MKTKISHLIIQTFLIVGLLPNSLRAQLPDYVPTEGIVAWWPFNGNANDESFNNHHGVVTGATLIQDRHGISNAAYSFDGIDDFINCTNDTDFNLNTLSISLWYYKTDDETMGGLVSKSTSNSGEIGYRVDIQDGLDYFIWSRMGDPSPTTGFVVSSSGSSTLNWHHLVITKSMGGATMFRDGVFMGSNENLTALISNNAPFLIGAVTEANLTSIFYGGYIDDIGIWDRVLNEEEIQLLFLAQITGCTDAGACNYNEQATENDGSCFYAQEFYNCAGNCLNDFDGDGICDELEFLGCTYTFACNYNPQATQDDGSCTIAQFNYDCEGNCILDLNNNGICDNLELMGCTYEDALNYNSQATLDDGTCLYTCQGDMNNDLSLNVNDLLIFLSVFGSTCSDLGCTDSLACNFNPLAIYDIGNCNYPDEFTNCDGTCINDLNLNGICDEIDEQICSYPEVFNPEVTYGEVLDLQGNVYKTVSIGEQVWMAENLRSTVFQNGDVIPNLIADDLWWGTFSPAWCYQQNMSELDCPYGKLYNWYVVTDDRNVCPVNWHIPNNNDWYELRATLGGENSAGGLMKAIGNQYWLDPNVGASNSSGFSALPSGNRGSLGDFSGVGVNGVWWSSVPNGNSGWTFGTVNGGTELSDYDGYPKKYGHSVRCVQD